ncbi:MAG: hypothetical protein ACQETB_05115 [Halobacteriota archaeon]
MLEATIDVLEATVDVLDETIGVLEATIDNERFCDPFDASAAL